MTNADRLIAAGWRPTTGMGIGGMEGVIAREDRNYRHGIREGERRMLRLVFIGAACACVLYHDAAYALWRPPARTARAGRRMLARAAYAREVAAAAADALRDLGDEDASRVLGERGW